ncbi:DoxX family protein [Natrinema salifodinae]|uniref:HR-like lesion-inducing n=1 Tax=Natrinema salifodinae TaxID=1202768 RepID=A0A1I0MGV1_9EURY|nr:DoxX family protein [Natrinema salifodinae]SEV86980.1 HR-like lesion-inducing [Natrinema salifodinae]
MHSLLQQQRERESDSGPRSRNESGGTNRQLAETTLFRLGRFIYGAILAFMAADNLRNLEGRVQYAEAKGAPAPSFSVPAISGGLLFGSAGVALWRAPVASAAAVAGFFAGVTPVMHDFWNIDDPEEQQQEFIGFAKNTALLGAALTFLQLGRSQQSER